MTAMTTTANDSCDPASAITRSLLGYGMIAGPLYVAVSLAQALIRDGFDITKHAWSLLANGGAGWIQVANLIVAGLMTVAFAVGLGRAIPTQRLAARLVGVYGAGMVTAGLFKADPALGFPVGTPADARPVSWHGLVHLAAGGVGFLALIAACLLLGRHFARTGERTWAVASRTAGVVFLAGFVGIASGAGSAATTIGFVYAVVLISGWMAVLAHKLYRSA